MNDKIKLFSSKIGGNCPGWVDSYWHEGCILDQPKMDETFRVSANYGATDYRDILYYGKKEILHNTPWLPVDGIHDLSKKNTQYFKNKMIEVDTCENEYNMDYWMDIDFCAVGKRDLDKYNPMATNKQAIKLWKPEGRKYLYKLLDWLMAAGVKRFGLNEPKESAVDMAVDMFMYLTSKGIDWRNLNMGFQHGSNAWNLFKRKLWAKTDPYDSKTDMFSSVHQVVKNSYVDRIIEGQYVTRRFFLSTDGDKPRPTAKELYDYYKPLFKQIKGRMKHVETNEWGFEVLNHTADNVEDSILGLSQLYKDSFGKYPENYGEYPKTEEPEPHTDAPPPHSDTPPIDPPIDTPSFWEKIWEWIKNLFGG